MDEVFDRRVLWWSFGAICAYLLVTFIHARYGYYFRGQGGFSLGNDDAFITFRYAKNLVDHGILSFNPGDAPPVEGFSNPLYLLASVTAYALVGSDMLYIVMAVTGALAVAFAITCLGRFAFERLGTVPAVIVMITVALNPALWIHGSSGLETAWVFLFQVVLWIASTRYADHATKRQFWLIIFSVATLVMLRTDGFVVPVFTAVWFAWRGNWRLALAIASTCIVVFFALMAARLMYYGLPMPLTFYVKVSGPILERLEIGWGWIVSIAKKNGMAVPLIGVVAVAITYGMAALKQRNWLITAPPLEVWVVGLLLAYYLYIGGDIYRERFLLIIFPMGIYALLSSSRPQVSLLWLSLVGIAIIAGQLSAFAFDKRLEYRFETPKYDRWVELGRFLANTHPGATLATGAAGKIPYFSGLETIDMLGLNNRFIAMTPAQGATPGHNKFDADYVFAQKPDLICSHVYGNGMMTYGLERPVYEAQGYVLRYLVRSRGFNGPGVLTLSQKDINDVTSFTQAGYFYGCAVNAGLDLPPKNP